MYSEEGFEIHPMRFGNFIETGGKKVFGIYLVAPNVPGVLASIAGKLAAKNVNIVGLNFSPSIERGVKLGIFLALDLSQSKAEIEDIARDIGEEFGRVKVIKPFKGVFLANTFNFPLMDGDRRGIIFSKVDTEMIVVGLRRRFGLAGLDLLYHWGLITGEHTAESYMKWGIESLEEAIELFKARNIVLGRCILEVEKNTLQQAGAEVREAIFNLKGLWECEIARENGIPGPSAQFTRGVLVGLLKRYTGLELDSEEVECIASGGEHCIVRVYEVSPTS